MDRFGFELRRSRKSRGLSQDRLGRLIHVSGDLIQRIEVGERRPSRDLAERCDEELQADGALLDAWDALDSEARRSPDDGSHTDNLPADTDTLATGSIRPPGSGRMVLPAVSLAGDGISVALGAVTGEGGISDDAYAADRAVIPCRTEDGRIIWVSVPRRAFVLGGIGAAASAISGAPIAGNPSAARLVANLRSAAGSPFERFEAMRKVLMDCDNLFGPLQAMRLVHDQLDIMARLRQDTRGADYRRLLNVEVQFADLLAWLYQDSGNHRDAQYWLGRALDWSHIAGDQGTIAFILARKSQLAGQISDAAEAVDVADAAIRQVPSHNLSAVIATTYAAHGHALRRDKTSCLRSYDRARELLTGVEDDPADWYGKFLNTAYIEAQRAHSLSVIGEYRTAAQAFQAALNAMPDSYYRDRGVYLTRKALAHAGAADAGENADEAVAEAANAGLEALAIGAETRSGRILTGLSRLDRKLSRWERQPSVDEYKNSMSEFRSTLTWQGQYEDSEQE
ncbi:MAG: helix-turn-helix domain-containing protein [Streptosporangiaceae bacterium]